MSDDKEFLATWFDKTTPIPIRRLISNTPDFNVNVVDVNKNTALYYAVTSSNIDWLKFLVSLPGINVNKIHEDDYHSALCIISSIECRKILIDAGADVNKKDHEGNTPLHRTGNYEFGRLLIEKGANVNAVNNYGNTTIMVRNTSRDYIKFLVDAGVDLSHKNNKGKTVFDIIPKENHDLLIRPIDKVNDVLDKIANDDFIELIKKKISTYTNQEKAKIIEAILATY